MLFSITLIFNIYQIRIWSFCTLLLEQRKFRPELVLHVNLHLFLSQLQTDFLYPTTYFLYSTSFSTRLAQGTEVVWVIYATRAAPRVQSNAFAQWHPHARMHRRCLKWDGRGESEPCEVRKRGNESRSEGLARTAWHLNRGFPPCTLSSLRSFCLHKGWLSTHSCR